MYGDLKRIQFFENGQKTSDEKVGIWLQDYEDGEVITGYDYSKNAEIDDRIRVNAYYPSMEIEMGIEGLVNVFVRFDVYCEIVELRVIKSLSQGCDEEALKAVRRIGALQKKYDRENCIEIEMNIPIEFRLNY